MPRLAWPLARRRPTPARTARRERRRNVSRHGRQRRLGRHRDQVRRDPAGGHAAPARGRRQRVVQPRAPGWLHRRRPDLRRRQLHDDDVQGPGLDDGERSRHVHRQGGEHRLGHLRPQVRQLGAEARRRLGDAGERHRAFALEGVGGHHGGDGDARTGEEGCEGTSRLPRQGALGERPQAPERRPLPVHHSRRRPGWKRGGSHQRSRCRSRCRARCRAQA